MNTPYGPLTDPDLFTVLQQLRGEIFSNFNCHQVGSIVTFNPANQTAEVQLSVLRQVPRARSNPPVFDTVNYPVLGQCPVFIPSGDIGGGGALTFPIKPGDPCLVLFNDRDLDNWWSTGNTAVPNSSRMHDFSDGLVLVGFRNLANVMGDYDMANAVFRYKGGKLLLADLVALNSQLSSLRLVLESVVTALTALNAKTGPTAAAQITAVTTEINKLLQP